MPLRVSDITIVHEIVGGHHMFTSPEVPELHVVNADRALAEGSLQPALDMIERMKARMEARRRMNEVRAYA
ncbi:hypothetical protein Sa4125_17810 [Aureimonas sp. SA4125]|uniref:hypothetical protein n=1 Tax=Aureimonas sp. SA4125 TaxID=2826993 RepID=UPI001CC78D8D|nr:hypothetical protein [Aureimonas sp. SA4125]BDA84239.1 hypothetical protein Sa4125_17810 [Aureimonas sp. SA4125]